MEKLKFLIVKLIQSWVASKYTAQQTKAMTKKNIIKKHYTGQEKESLKKAY